jgi:hypothetical protein
VLPTITEMVIMFSCSFTMVSIDQLMKRRWAQTQSALRYYSAVSSRSA